MTAALLPALVILVTVLPVRPQSGREAMPGRLSAELALLRLEERVAQALTVYAFAGREGNRRTMARWKGELSRLYGEEKL